MGGGEEGGSRLNIKEWSGHRLLSSVLKSAAAEPQWIIAKTPQWETADAEMKILSVEENSGLGYIGLYVHRNH